MPEQLNLHQTQEKFEDFLALDGNTDRRNLNCAYYVDGGPGCVMAHFFIWLGLPEEVLDHLHRSDNNETSIVGNDLLLLPFFDEHALWWLDRIQGKADGGSSDGFPTWKEALYEANQPDEEGTTGCAICDEAF